jgi:hypothetical protein
VLPRGRQCQHLYQIHLDELDFDSNSKGMANFLTRAWLWRRLWLWRQWKWRWLCAFCRAGDRGRLRI